jgi:branched-chain amino acid transport system substrate-binding protein
VYRLHSCFGEEERLKGEWKTKIFEFTCNISKFLRYTQTLKIYKQGLLSFVRRKLKHKGCSAVTKLETGLVIVVIILAAVAGVGYWQAATVAPSTTTVTQTMTTTVSLAPAATATVTVTQPVTTTATVTATKTVTQPVTTTATATVTQTVTAAPKPPEPIRIGVLFPLTGEAAPMGEEHVKGIQVYADIVNNVWGGIPTLGGAKIELVIADTTSDPKVATSEAERLITKEKVIAILGAYRSADTLPASEVAERYGIPFVASAGHPLITGRGFKYVFRAHPPVVPTTNWAVDLVKNVMGYATAAVLCENSAMGQSMYNMSLTRAKAVGLTIVHSELYDSKAPDLSPMLLKVKAAKPDAIIAGSYLTDAVLLVKQMREYDVNVKAIVFIGGGVPPEKFLELAGKDAEYVIITGLWNHDSKRPSSIEFIEAWQKKFGAGSLPDQMAAEAYESAVVLVDAITRARSTDPKAIRDALAKTQLISISGPIEFDERGENKYGYANTHILQVQGGKWVTVLPAEAATAKLITPMPPWSAR